MKTPFYYWLAPFFYLIVVFFSGFANVEFTAFYPNGFGFWFVILFFTVCLGFIFSYLLGLRTSLWIILIVWLISSLMTSLIVLIRPSIFGFSNFSLANLVVQFLKNFFASVFGLLGVLIWQTFYLQKVLIKAEEKIRFYEKNLIDAKREAEVLKHEAEVKAEELIFDAKKKVQDLEKLKRDLEIKIREFLQVELAVLDKHEEDLKE